MESTSEGGGSPTGGASNGVQLRENQTPGNAAFLASPYGRPVPDVVHTSGATKQPERNKGLFERIFRRGNNSSPNADTPVPEPVPAPNVAEGTSVTPGINAAVSPEVAPHPNTSDTPADRLLVSHPEPVSGGSTSSPGLLRRIRSSGNGDTSSSSAPVAPSKPPVAFPTESAVSPSIASEPGSVPAPAPVSEAGPASGNLSEPIAEASAPAGGAPDAPVSSNGQVTGEIISGVPGGADNSAGVEPPEPNVRVIEGNATTAAESADKMSQEARRTRLLQFTDSMGHIAVSWLTNADPRNLIRETWSYRLGYGAGILESAALSHLPIPIPFVKGRLKYVINAAAINTASEIAKRYYQKKRSVLEAKHTDPAELEKHIKALEESHTITSARVRKFADGMSAASTAFAIGNLLIGAGEITGEKTLGVNLKDEVFKRIDDLIKKVQIGEAINSVGGNFHQTLQGFGNPSTGGISVTNSPAGNSSSMETITQVSAVAGAHLDQQGSVTANYGSVQNPQFGSQASGEGAALSTSPMHSSAAGSYSPGEQGAGQPRIGDASAASGNGHTVPGQTGGMEDRGGNNQDLLQQTINSDEFVNQTAAAVGQELGVRDQIVDSVIRAQGIDPNAVPPAVLEQMREAVQHGMESLANRNFQSAAESYYSADPQNFSFNLPQIELQGHNDFLVQLLNHDTQNGLSAYAREILVNYQANQEVLTQAAAASVGQHLPLTDEVTRQVLASQHISPNQLSRIDYDHIREAVQHSLETQANQSYSEVLETNGDTNLPQVVAQAHQQFVNSLTEPQVHDQLAQAATNALHETQQSQDAIQQHITRVLGDHPGEATETQIVPNTTVSNLLAEHGMGLNWDASDADNMAAHIAINYNLLTQMWADQYPAGQVPDGMQFPVNLSELGSLADKAKAGDPDAIQRLRFALRWIPANDKFTILNKAGVADVMNTLKQT